MHGREGKGWEGIVREGEESEREELTDALTLFSVILNSLLIC